MDNELIVLVSNKVNQNTLIFHISNELVDKFQTWSTPHRFKFIRNEDSSVTLVLKGE